MNNLTLHSSRMFITLFGKYAVLLAVFAVLAKTGSAQCIDPTRIDENAVCIEVYKPVCGCNGVTYSNSCVADASGLLSYTEGACPEKEAERFFLSDTVIGVGDTVHIGWDAKCKCAIDWTKYEAVSVQYSCAISIGNGTIVGLSPGVAEIRITELSTSITSSLFLTVADADEHASAYYVRYLPTKVTNEGKYTVSLFCKTGLDCCNTHALSAALTDGNTINLSVISTKINCPTQDVCAEELRTQLTDLPQGEYSISYGMFSVMMSLGDTTSSQAYKMRTEKSTVAVGESAAIHTVDNSAIDWSKYELASSDASVASVSATGIVTGKKNMAER